MSLIMDAQKAAQREKDRRASGVRDNVPVLVPLRTRARKDFSWVRMASIAIGGGVVVSGAAIVFLTTRDTVPRALRTPGPTVVEIAAPAAASTKPGSAKEVVRPDQPPPKAPASKPAGATKSTVARTAPRQASVRRLPASADRSRQAEASGLHIAVENPQQAEAARLFAMGVAAHKSGDLAAARLAYGRVLAIAPNDVDALNNLGVLLLAVREFDQAESALRKAVSLSPGNAGAWNNLGTVLRERGKSADAIAAFQRALAIDPAHDGAKVSLAQQYLVIGSLGQARQLLEEVLARAPAHPEANYALGQVLERQGDKAGAVRAYQAFIASAPATLATYVESVRRRVEALSRNP